MTQFKLLRHVDDTVSVWWLQLRGQGRAGGFSRIALDGWLRGGWGGAKGFAKRGFQALTHACVQEEKLRDRKIVEVEGNQQRRDSAGGMWRCWHCGSLVLPLTLRN